MNYKIFNDSDNYFLNNNDTNTQELWQRRYIGMHTYIPSIVVSILALCNRFF
jgi:hypothetical protein